MKEYNLVGQPWENNEDKQLIKEYNIDQLSLLEICKIHKRLPGGIISRLMRLNIIDMRNKARGYSEYQQSDLYKERCKKNAEARSEKKEEKLLGKSVDIKKQTLISNAFATKEEDSKYMFIPDDTNNIIKSPEEHITPKYLRGVRRLERAKVPSDVAQLKEDVKEIKENVLC